MLNAHTPVAATRGTRGTRQRSALRTAAVAVLVLGSALFGAAAPASAHNDVLGTSPAADAVLTQQPGSISVSTSDALLGTETGNAIVVRGPASAPRYYGDDCGVVTGGTLALDAQLGQPGTYTVTWRAISVDSHVISGSFEFEWAPEPGVPLAEGTTEPACAAASGSGQGDAGEPAEGTATPGVAPGDLLWIGGALAAVLAAVAVTVLVLRRRP